VKNCQFIPTQKSQDISETLHLNFRRERMDTHSKNSRLQLMVNCGQCIDERMTVILVEGGRPASIKYRLLVPPSKLCPNNTHDSCHIYIDHLPQDHSPPQSVPSVLILERVVERTHATVFGMLAYSHFLD